MVGTIITFVLVYGAGYVHGSMRDRGESRNIGDIIADQMRELLAATANPPPTPPPTT